MTAVIATTGPWMSAFVGCAVLAAIISTATSLINAIGSNISCDFNVGSSKMFVSKTITCVISIGAIFCAFFFNNIVDILIQSYGSFGLPIYTPSFRFV